MWNQEGYFIPLSSMKMKSEGEQDGSSDSGCCHSSFSKQIKYKLHIAAGSWWRVAAVWFGHSGCVDHVCGVAATGYLSYL